VGESSLKLSGEVSAATTRNELGVPVEATSALDSKTTRLPSPLRVGLRLSASSGVWVKRRGASVCECAPLKRRQKTAAMMRATAKRLLAVEAKAVLLCLSRSEVKRSEVACDPEC
jgi:hypothetical protein